MNHKIQVGITMLSWVFLTTSSIAQTKEWNIGKTEDGKITVKSYVSKRTTENGKEEQLVEYAATTTTDASMKKLISIVKDISKHKEYMGQKESVKLKTFSDHEWVVYYFYKGVWPYPSSDIVAKMVYDEDVSKKVTTFTLTAAPSLLERRDVRRLDYYNLTYLFKELNNGNVEITITAKFTPAVQLPVFIMNTWFPDGPADYLLGLIKLANESN